MSFKWLWVALCILVGLASCETPKALQKRHSAKASPVVIVTVIDPSSDDDLKAMVTSNRKQYAAQHDYIAFLPNGTDYTVEEHNVPQSWAKIPAVRHAMTLFEESTYFFYLDPTALITDPRMTLEKHITGSARLAELMIVDQPIVPPDSVIRTLSAKKIEAVDFIVTQDHEGLSQESFIVRRGDWARYFLDSWYDPLYRSYNFQRAEGHALEHLVQWHGTILSRLAIVPQTIMNSYVGNQPHEHEQYQAGHFIANMRGCGNEGQAPCAALMKPYFETFTSLLIGP